MPPADTAIAARIGREDERSDLVARIRAVVAERRLASGDYPSIISRIARIAVA